MDGQREQPPQQESDKSGQESRTVMQRLESHLWRRMLAGLLALMPLLACLLILRFAFNFIDHIFRGEDGLFAPLIEGTFLDFPGIGVIVMVAVLYSVGALAASKLGARIIGGQGIVLSRIPVVKRIFGVAQQAADSITSQKEHQYSRVVFLEWPRRGVLAMGFVTGHCQVPGDAERMVLVVYIPTIPNPTSGMLAFVRDDEVVETDLSVEDAMKIVFSGGIVMPESMHVDPNPELARSTADC